MNNNIFTNSSFNDQFSRSLNLGPPLGSSDRHPIGNLSDPNSLLPMRDVRLDMSPMGNRNVLGNLSQPNSLLSTRDTRWDMPLMPGARSERVHNMPLPNNPGVKLEVGQSPLGVSLNADRRNLHTTVGGHAYKEGFDAYAGATYEIAKHHNVHGAVRGGFTSDGERVSQGVTGGYYHDISPNTKVGVKLDRDMAKASGDSKPTNTFSFWSLFKI